MRRTILVALLACASGVAWAKGGAVVQSAAVGGGRTGTVTTGGAVSGAPVSSGATSGGFGAPSAPSGQMATSNNGVALPPPPPSSVTQTAAQQGSLPAQQPAPLAEQQAGFGPTNGLSPQLNNLNRPSSALNATQLSSVQASLAAGGLYSGPIDGINSAATRAAIAQYQQVQGLPATGNLDAETMARLDRGGATASNGAASTAGNASSATAFGFATGATLTPNAAPATGGFTNGNGVTAPVTGGQAAGFGLSNAAAVNMSPFPPAGSTIQP